MRFIFLHLPVLGEESVRAAEAVECAGEQDLFWEYHDVLFEDWDGGNDGTSVDASLIRLAVGVGLDPPEFQECLDSRRYLERIGVHRQMARSINITSTPSVIIGNQVLPGLREYAAYRDQIELALARGAE